MLTANRPQLLDQLIGASIADFDIPLDVYERAVARYDALGNWLADYWAETSAGGVVYPQGSIRLGTVVQPITDGAEYDIDLVCRRDIAKQATTQQELKSDVGAAIKAYVASGPDGSPQEDEGGRCWTLDYPHEPFHMDVLPALPDEEATPNGIVLTDRDLVRWQPSNPVDFATWFYAQMERELAETRAVLAKEMDVEDVPAWYVKTTLQRTVQALKRHRDIYFEKTPDDRPSSIIITTLAARAYAGSGTLFDVLLDVTAKMPTLVERRDGVWWVANPVQPKENFADRWRTNPGREARFFEWIEQAHTSFADFGEELGVDRVLTKVAKSFGQRPADTAGAEYAAGFTTARDEGRLEMAARSGTLGAAAASVTKPVPTHTFHGDASERP